MRTLMDQVQFVGVARKLDTTAVLVTKYVDINLYDEKKTELKTYTNDIPVASEQCM